MYGPFLVEPVPDEPYQVKLVSGIIDETDIPTSETHENPHYIFGKSGDDGKLCRVLKMQNQGLDKITITAVVEDDSRFQFDNITAPPIVYPPLIPFPDLPDATNLRVYESDPNMIVEWDAAIDPTPDTYTVSISEDGSLYTDEQTTALLTVSYPMPDYADKGVFVRIVATNADGTGDPLIIFRSPYWPNRLEDPEGLLLIDDEGGILVSS